MIGIIGGTGVYNIAEKADNEEKIKVANTIQTNIINFTVVDFKKLFIILLCYQNIDLIYVKC